VARNKEVPFDPAKYLLDTNSGQIDVFVHKSVAPTSADFKPDTMAVRRGRFQIPGEFTPPTADTEWGFGKVITPTDGPTPEWIKYIFSLPPFTQEGTDWDGIINTVATLSTLFDHLNFSDKTSTAKVPQLEIVDMTIGQTGATGWPLNAEITPTLDQHIAEQVETGEFPNMQKRVGRSMFEAYATLIRLQTESSAGFRLEKEETLSLHAQTTTHASLHTSTTYPGGGFYLMPHNVIVPQQQLTLLAGISKLSSSATQKLGY